MTRLRLLLAAAAIAALALFAVACGDDEEPVTTTVEDSQNGDDSRRVVIEAEEGAFDARAVYEAASPGVVTVTSVFPGNPAAGLFGGEGGRGGQGSGFVISEDGEIVTNAHVVTDADEAGQTLSPDDVSKAREVYVQFPDRNQVSAEIVGVDPYADVALLRVDPEGLDLTPLPLGSEDEIEVGEWVAAIGSPFGEEQSLSVGVVSAENRDIQGLTRFQIGGAIQTDASINPGNSGGPLLNAEGEVVGINQQIQTSSGGNQGVGYALPIDLAKRAVDELRDDGEVNYAYAGVTTQALYPQVAERLGLPTKSGAVVVEVERGSPADEAGLRGGEREITFQGAPWPVGADVITAVDGERVVGESDLPRLVAEHRPGDEVELTIIRDGEEMTVTLELGDRAEAAGGG